MSQVPINKNALAWAIESSGIPDDKIDAYFNFPVGTIEGWLGGEKQPNQTQFNKLKSKLKRPAAVFFMAHPPETSESDIEYRVALGDSNRTLPPKARFCIRDSIRVQRFVKDIMIELGLKVSVLPTNSTNEDPEIVADLIREKYFKVPVSTQLVWSSEAIAFREWRQSIEQLGILVFLYPIGKNPDQDDTTDENLDFLNSVRGFSNTSVSPPVIGISTTWSITVRIYTLFHELAHILTRTSSACAEVYGSTPRDLAADKIERWCESFSASFLMPRDAIKEISTKIHHCDAINRAGSISKRFRVSRKAALIRLIEIGEATWDDYKLLDSQFDQKPSFGGVRSGKARNRAVIRKHTYGSCLALVRKAYEAGIVNEVDLMDYLHMAPDELT